MSTAAPPIDTRSAAHVARQTEALLKTYAPAWNEIDPVTGRSTGLSAGLVGVFARFVELTIQRLNQAPDKNRLAFLDMLGATPLSAQPAEVPLTFVLAKGATAATVPARTQVAAQPPEGGKPILFETEDVLSLTPATLVRVVSWDGVDDRFADHGEIANPGNTAPVPVFQGNTPVTHAFYLTLSDLFRSATVTTLTVTVALNQTAPPADPYAVQWELWDGHTATPLAYLGAQTGRRSTTRTG